MIYYSTPRTIIPHRLLQSLRSHLRFILFSTHFMRDLNELKIREYKEQDGKAPGWCYELRYHYDKSIKKISKIQTKVKRVEGGSKLFTHSDLQRLEKFITSMHFFKDMAETQYWVRKQKHYSIKQ